MLGTPNYMSPEQALGDKVDGRTDLFSTGAVLYELLTGHKPFEAETTPSVLFQVVHKQPPPVRRWAPEMPAAVVAVVNRALEKDLKRRFPLGRRHARGALDRAQRVPSAARRGGRSRPRRCSRRRRCRRTPRPRRGPRAGHDPAAASPAGRCALERRPAPASPTPGAAARPARPACRASSSRAGARRASCCCVVGGLLAPRARDAAAGRTTGRAADALTQELVRKQLQLAQRELENKNYRAALDGGAGRAQAAAGNAEARAVVEAPPRRSSTSSSAPSPQARRLLEAGDNEGRLARAPEGARARPALPAAAELQAQLDSAFKAQARAGRRLDARRARGGAGRRHDGRRLQPRTRRRGRATGRRRAASSRRRRAATSRHATLSSRRARRRRRGPPLPAARPSVVAATPAADRRRPPPARAASAWRPLASRRRAAPGPRASTRPR